jgi:acyl-CoA reductase-like NAD-dependent aldehyde dehydrogenase
MAIRRQLIIGGRHVDAASGRTTSDLNPYTGQAYAEVAAAGSEDVRRAVDAASDAFEAWAATPPTVRGRIFTRAAEILESHRSDAVTLMAEETGGVNGWAQFNVGLAADIFRSAAAATAAPRGDVLATDMPGVYSLAVREPHGVVAAISPWNAPLILGTRAVAIPLAVGNTVVLKPSEDAPLACGLFIADVLMEAGIPDGVINVITSAREDGPAVVESLISDERVRCVNFTGSTNVGRRIGVLAAENLKPAILELGGKNSIVVLKDADIDHAVNASVFGSFMHAGQICMSVDRIVIDKSIADEFTEKFAARAASLPAGDPKDPSTVIGPAINEASTKRQYALIDDATAKGATVLAGGERMSNGIVPATVLGDVTDDMDIYAKEIFGAITTIFPVDGTDAAVEFANNTRYGLTAGVITENAAEGMKVAQRLKTGIVHVNDQPIADEPMAPFGGVGDSGYGRFGGQAGINSFTTTRWVTIQEHGHPAYPF